MKQVEGYTKEDYIQECMEQGGRPVEYPDMETAVRALCVRYLNMGGFITPEEAAEGIENETNCDWVIMNDGTVLFRDFIPAAVKKLREALGEKTVGQLAAEIAAEVAPEEPMFRIKAAGTWARYSNTPGTPWAGCIPDAVKALVAESVRKQGNTYHIIAKGWSLDGFRPEREDLVNMLCGVPVSYEAMALLDRMGLAELFFYCGGLEDRAGWNRERVEALPADDLLTVYMMVKRT